VSGERETVRLLRVLGLLAGGGGLLLLAAARWWGRTLEHLARCPLRNATGVPCPTCGGTHAVLALARGDLPAALRENPLVTLGALLAALWTAWAVAATFWPPARRLPSLSSRARRRLAWTAAALLLANWLYELAVRHP